MTHLSWREWNRRLSSLHGAFLCGKHALPSLRENGGAIVNIASTRALQSEPDSEAYAAAKGGLLALTHALASSAGPSVRVNAISPGWIAVENWKKSAERGRPKPSEADHAHHPAGRVGVPEDIGRLAVYLLSSQLSGFVTGQTVQRGRRHDQTDAVRLSRAQAASRRASRRRTSCSDGTMA